MKKVIFSVIFVFVCAAVNAQIYEPYIFGQSSTNTYNNDLDPAPRRSYNNQPQTQKRIVQTTAYYINDNGNYAKVPIKVTINDSPYKNDSVTSFYDYNWGINGGWRDCDAAITKCSSVFGSGLETQFMYKACILAIGLNEVYFDL